MDNRADSTNEGTETGDAAREAARKISKLWRSGSFRKDGGVVEGITPIVQEAIDAGFEECRFLWKHEEGKLHEQLKDAQDEAFDAYAEGDALREQIKQHKAEYDRLSGIIEIDTLRIVELEEQLSAERILNSSMILKIKFMQSRSPNRRLPRSEVCNTVKTSTQK